MAIPLVLVTGVTSPCMLRTAVISASASVTHSSIAVWVGFVDALGVANHGMRLATSGLQDAYVPMVLPYWRNCPPTVHVTLVGVPPAVDTIRHWYGRIVLTVEFAETLIPG